MMNSLNQSTLSFGSNFSSSRGGSGGDDELETCSIISFGSHRSSNTKATSNVYKNQQAEIKAETVYSLLSMLTCNNIKEEMCNKFYSMSLDKRISLEMRSHGCIPLLIQLIHPIGDDAKYQEDDDHPIMNWDETKLEKDEIGYNRFDDNSLDGTEFDSELKMDEENLKELEIRNKACIALRNIIKFSEETKTGKKEMRVLQLLEEIRGFCDKFKRGKGDLGVSMAHPGEATSQLMKISFDEEHRVAICLLGGLHAIAELIFFDNKYHGNTTSPQCITVRRYAFMALTNLTFGDGTNKSILCSNKLVIRSVIEQLYSPSEELRQVTASVLRNLSWKADDQGKDTLREMGAVRLLMRAALEARKESTLKSILTALWNLSAHSTTNKAEICAVEGALKFLVSTLNYQSSNNTMIIIENGGGILRNVSSYIARHEHLRAILREHDTLSILLEQLESPSLTIVSNACATLWNLSARCIQDQMKLIDLGAIPMLRNLINSKHKMISMGSAAALKNLSSVKNYHEMVDSNCFSSSSRNSSCNSPSTTNTTSASTTPTLLARKSNGFRPELDDSLSETCDNLESPKSSPAHVRRFHPPPPITRYDLPDRMYTSFTVPTLSNPYPYMSKSSSKDSLGSTHSEPVYYPFNNRTSNQNQQSSIINNSQPHLESALPRSASHGFNPPTYPPPPPPPPSSSSSNYTNDLSHLFHAYPIKISDVKEGDKTSPIDFNSLTKNPNSDFFDKKILESARRNVENLLSSPNGQYLSTCYNSLQSGVKSPSDENVTSKTHERLLPRHKFDTDGSGIGNSSPQSNGDYKNEPIHILSNLPTDLTRSFNRLTFTSPKSIMQDENDLLSQCNLIDFSSSNLTKKVKNENTILEENEENLTKEEMNTINNNDKSILDDELLSHSTLNRSISSTNNQSINFGDNCVTTSMDATPIMFSRTSSLGSISGLEIKSIGTSISSVPSEFGKATSDPISPTDLPDSPTQTEPNIRIMNSTTISGDEIETHYNVKSSFQNPLSSENIHSFGQTRMIFEKQHLKSLEINQNKSSGLDENPSIQINETITTKVEKVTQIIDQFQEENCINNLRVYKSSGMETCNNDDCEMLNGPLTSIQPESSVSLYSLESHDISNIKPPSCIDEASLSLESSNFPSLEFTSIVDNTTKPEPPKVISTILSAENRKVTCGGIEGFLESTNPPSDMEAISGLSSSCGSLNSLDSDDYNLAIVKEFDPEATKLIKKQTQDIIQLTRSHNDDTEPPLVTTVSSSNIIMPPKPILQRNDTFNCDGQNESEDDSRATYICTPRRARIVKPVLRTQTTNQSNNNSMNNKSVRRFNSTSTPSSARKLPSNDTISNKNRSLVIKGTKTTALRGNRSKSTPEGPNEKDTSITSSSVPTTPVKKLNSTNNNETKFSSKTYVVRKRTNSTVSNNSSEVDINNSSNNYGHKNRSLTSNSTSIHNLTDRITGNLQNSVISNQTNSSSTTTSSSTLSLNKRIPVQSKIASLWKRSHPEKENVTNQTYIPLTKCESGTNNSTTVSRPNKFGVNFTQMKTTVTTPSIHPSPSTPLASVSSTSTTTSLTRSSTYEKLPSSPGEAIKMQSNNNLPTTTINRKEMKETNTSRVPLNKNRIRPAQDQITSSLNTNSKQSKVIILRSETKRKGSLVN